ncbi:MAG TPA: hypothetical protein VFH81_04865 [Actinomycetota bacterium]|nr:hypothetical protein [Actinomycetota bacterium]
MTRVLARLPIGAGVTLLLLFLPPFAQRAEGEVIVPCEPEAFVFLVPAASFEDLLGVSEVRALAGVGGAALMSLQGGLPTREASLPRSCQVAWRWLDPIDFGGLSGVGKEISREVLATTADEVIVFVGSTTSSPAMLATKDLVHPLVLGTGAPAILLEPEGAPRTLASDTTRRTGVVTDLDVRPTIFEFLGRAVPTDLDGLPLRLVDEPPPFELHERYLAMRRMTVPVQAAAALYAVVGGLFGIALIAMRRRVPQTLARAGAWVGMSVPAMGVALLAAGHLPTLSYATVVPFVIGATAVGTLAFAPLAQRDALLPPAAIGIAVLLFFLVEAAMGWTAALTPFLGGSELDGGRFFGLPNVFVGLLIGASLYVAFRLSPGWGFALVVAVALFAGLPFAGANIGAAVSLFAAAGLWFCLRTRGRLGWREAGITAALVVVGTGVILFAHRFLTSTPTHITRFEEATGWRLGDVWRTFTHRLSTGWRLIEQNPFALVPVIGLPATLLAVLRPPPLVRQAFHRHPAWRDALLVALLSGIVAYVANDTGPAAIGLAFGMGLGGLVYVSLIEEPAKMEAP